MTRGRALRGLVAGAAVVVAAACTSEPRSDPVTTSPGPGPTARSITGLADLREAAGIPPCPVADGEPSPASELPELELPCLGGGPDVSVAQLVGTPYVVNFWASTCIPCVEEVPYLQEVADQAAGRVQVLGVNYLDLEDRALLAAPDFGLRFPSLFDPDGELGPAFRFQGLPATFFVDDQGVIVGEHVGAFESADEVRQAIARELGIRL
jgi:thiol-disulfide isomerase/thioredoxin